MVKRVPTDTAAVSPSKKKKLSNPSSQARLDAFFASASGSPSSTQRRETVDSALSANSRREIIDVDQLDEGSPQPASLPPLNACATSSTAATRVVPPRTPTKAKREAADAASTTSPRHTTASPFSRRAVTNAPFPSYSGLATDPPFFSLDAPAWPPGTPARYSLLSDALSQLTETKSRIAIVNILTNTLRLLLKHDPTALLSSLYLLSNSLAPPYIPTELGVGSSSISRAIQHVSGLTPAALKRLYNQSGDPGDVAFEAKSNVRTLIPHPPLLVSGVYETLLKIANSRGQGVAKTKQALVERLLLAARGEECRFLVRTLCQNLRVGAVRASLLTALARAVALTPPNMQPKAPDLVTTPSDLVAPSAQQDVFTSVPLMAERVRPLLAAGKKDKAPDEARLELAAALAEAEALVKRVFVQRPDYGALVAALLDGGLHSLAERVPLTVGIPLHPTLGSPTRSLDEIYERLQELPFTAEFKYDGQRAQIHAWRRDATKLSEPNAAGAHDADVSVKIFSRHLEDMTDKYPDVIELVRTLFATHSDTLSFILDAEIVAIDPRDGALRTFQELSNRARKAVNATSIEVAVGVFAFDLMQLNGEILLAQPFRKRRALLRAGFPPLVPEGTRGAVVARFDHVKSIESSEGREAVEVFWQESVESRSEGLMIKLLDSGEVIDIDEGAKKSTTRRKPLPATYEPDKRTSAWLKLKKDYVVGLSDSLDLIPVGAWHGNGRKAQWWSPVLLAVWDKTLGKPVALCKCMSGFSDAFYKDMRARYEEDSDACSKQPLWECETGGLRPAVYFKPQEVWEIRGADITISPVSVAARGLVSDARGLSLRFPRFIRIRDDKHVEDASSPEFVAGMYRQQQGRGQHTTGADEGELLDGVLEESEVEEDEEDL